MISSKMNSLKLLLASGLIPLLSSSIALAHPHEDTQTKEPAKKAWPVFGETSDEMDIEEFANRLEERMTKHSKALRESMKKADISLNNNSVDLDSKDTAQNLRDAGRALEEAFSDSGMFSGMVNMLAGLAEDFDVEDKADGKKVFKFDGQTLGHIQLDQDRHETNSMSISGLGKNLTLNMEKYKKDGKSKTRIVIEMDGGNDVEINMPDFDEKN